MEESGSRSDSVFLCYLMGIVYPGHVAHLADIGKNHREDLDVHVLYIENRNYIWEIFLANCGLNVSPGGYLRYLKHVSLPQPHHVH